MLNISLQEAKDKLPELINLVEKGEEVVIIGNNKTKIGWEMMNESSAWYLCIYLAGYATWETVYTKPSPSIDEAAVVTGLTV